MTDVFLGRVLGGRYELQELLGEDHTAHTFAAHDRRLGRQVAIRIVKTGYTVPPDAIAVLDERVRTIAGLHHPHILDVYDRGTEIVDSVPRFYLVTQLTRGRTLADRLETGALSPDEVEHILRGICGALDCAHEHGVLHLNLEPRNVLLDEDRVRVAGFGLARLVSEGTSFEAYTDTATPDYESPEQLSGGQIGPSSDIYALGIILHQMLAGRLPERVGMDADMSIRPSHSLPPALQTITLTATHPDPQQRYHTARELAEAFVAAIHPYPAHVIALRQALRQLAKLLSDQDVLDKEQITTHALAQSGVFSALDYGELSKEVLLQHQPYGIVLGAPAERPLAVITFIPRDHPPQNELIHLGLQCATDRLPDMWVLCDGCELWVYRRIESDFSPHPTLHLSLRDTTDLDVQALHEWLGRHQISPPDKRWPTRRAWIWGIVGGLITLAILATWLLPGTKQRLEHRMMSALFRVALTATASPTPTMLPSATPQPSSTPTTAPSPTATIVPYLTLVGGELNVYSGPGIIYDLLGAVHTGDRLLGLGRVEDSTWVQVQYAGHSGWIVRQFVVANVDVKVLPVIDTPTPPPGHRPDIERVDMVSTMIEAGSTITMSCQAWDQDQGPLTYRWAASAGSIIGEGNHVVYSAPQEIGSQTIEVTVQNGHGSSSSHTIQVLIAPVVAPSGMLEPTGVFGQLWGAGIHSEMRHGLGGATGEDSATDGAQQFFERGQMLWRKDIRKIYVLAQNGTWQRFSDTWEDGMDISSCLEATQQMPAPIRGFGIVWCKQLGSSNADIGWATTDEQPHSVHWQAFENGLMGQGLDGSLAGYIYVLYEDDYSWQLYPPPTREGPSSCPYAPRQRVQVADRARVCTGRERLVLHAQPQRRGSEVTRLEPGTLFTVMDGPVCANGWSWWKIHTDSGTVGWVAEGGDATDPYFICPDR